MAEKLEEDHDYEEALVFYEKAAELYLADETPTQGMGLLVKAADLIILCRDFTKLRNAIKVIRIRILNISPSSCRIMKK